MSILGFPHGFVELYHTLSGAAVLESHEPNLKVSVDSEGSAGHLL